MRAISKIYAVAVLCAILLSGCANSYSDPMDFLKGPGHEALMTFFKEEMAQSCFKGFKFSDAKVEMEKWGGECVTANFSMIYDEDYYHLVYEQGLEGYYKITFSDSARPEGEIGEKVRLIDGVTHNLYYGRCLPVFYGDKLSASECKKKFTADFRISIPRAKDGEGIYRVSGQLKDLRFGEYSYWNPTRMTQGLVSESNLKKAKLPKAGSKEARERVEEFKRECEALKKELPELERLLKEYKAVNEMTGRREDRRYRWIENEISLRSMKDVELNRLYREKTKTYHLKRSKDKSAMQAQEEQIAAEKAKANAAYDEAFERLKKTIAEEHAKRLVDTKKQLEDMVKVVCKRLGIK